MSDSSPNSPISTTTSLSGEALRTALQKQIEFYFSRANLAQDTFLVSQMNASNQVPIQTIANFKMIKSLTDDKSLIIDVMKSSSLLIVDETSTYVKPNIKTERCTLILRDVKDVNEKTLRALFEPIESDHILSIRTELGDTVFIVFDNEEVCLSSKPIQVRLKSENLLKSLNPPPVYSPPLPPPFPYYSPVYSPYGYSAYPPMPYGFGPPFYYPDPNHPFPLPMAKPAHNMPRRVGEYPSNHANSSNSNININNRKKKSNSSSSSHNTSSSSSVSSSSSSSSTSKEIHNTNIKSTRKKASKSTPKFGPDAFPALPTKVEGNIGYKRPYIKYTREQMATIVSKLTPERPSDLPDSIVTRSEPNTHCQLLDPFPVMLPSSPSPLLAAVKSDHVPELHLDKITLRSYAEMAKKG